MNKQSFLDPVKNVIISYFSICLFSLGTKRILESESLLVMYYIMVGCYYYSAYIRGISFSMPDKSTVSMPVGTPPNLTTENSKRPHKKNSPFNK